MRKTTTNLFPAPLSWPAKQIGLGDGLHMYWATPVAAAALALSLGLASLNAQALSLGRVTVQSALGEPLRAEIDVPDINSDEAVSLRAAVASPDAFRAAGLEYNPALSNLQVSLQRRADGRAYLRLSSTRAINEPFVDLILEANWASGRIVRDYTMLFDPPDLRTPAPATATTPAAISAPAQSPSAPATMPAAPTSTAPAARAPATTEARAPRPVAVKAEKPVAKADGGVTVKAGDTAASLAARYKPADVSLDQMLVSMLRTNPNAFIDNNVNRLKAGAVLDVPNQGQASSTPAAEARQIIVAQSKDFNEFRRRLAEGAPTTATPAAGRQSTGSVQAKVQERKPTAAAPDKLTLSKGAVGAASGPATKGGKEDAIAKDRQAKDAATRVAELSKNIQDLNQLNKSATPGKSAAAASSAQLPASAPKVGLAVTAVPAPTTSPAPAPVVAKPVAPASVAVPAPVVAVASMAKAPTVTVATTPIVPTATSATASVPKTSATAATTTATASPASVAASAVANVAASAPAIAASAPAIASASAAKPPAPRKMAEPPPPEPGIVDQLMDNPATLPATGGLLALLAGFGIYRARQRKKSTQVDSSFLESRLQPDSFFGASGGQRVDTNDASGATGSSMVYSPSQLDAAGDVDPVAEADVYLAYGRDLQAEEILKEAMRTNPSRVAIHNKLLEIYAKRRDNKAFESVANEAYSITRGEGPEWDAACVLGQELDPSNPLYQPGGRPTQGGAAGAAAAGLATIAFASNTAPQAAHPELGADQDVDLDLDLDFSIGDDLVEAPMLANEPAPGLNFNSTSPIHVQPTQAFQAIPNLNIPSVDLDFDNNIPSTKAADPVKLSVPDMASFASGLSFTPEPTPNATAPMPLSVSTSADIAPLEFDLGGLTLDFDTPGKPAAAADPDLTGDPLETKLALAQEFREIGDTDGARALAQEVVSEAQGALKQRAQRMVADLS